MASKVIMSHYQANPMGGFCLGHGCLLPYLSSRLPQVISSSKIFYRSSNLQPWTRVSYSSPSPKSTGLSPGCCHWLLVRMIFLGQKYNVFTFFYIKGCSGIQGLHCEAEETGSPVNWTSIILTI